MCRFKTATVDIFIYMLIPEINYSTWYLAYRDVYEGNGVSDINMAIREAHKFNKEYLRLIPPKIKCHCVGLYRK